MLALDNTIGCIEASESDILVLYRSLNTAFAAGGRSEFREAYVCAIRKTGKVSTYLALIADNGRVVVYTKPGEPDTEEGYQETVEEALNFARSLGFEPEPVNLNYSSAMREVVVRNIRILRPPASKMDPLLKNGKADAPTPAGAGRAAAAPKPSPVPPQAPPQQPAATHQEIDELKIVRNSLSNMKIELSLLAAEKNLLAARLQELTELQETTETELAKARKQGSASAPQLATLKREVSVLSKQLNDANNRNVEAAERNAELEETVLRVTGERDAALRRVEKLTAEKKKAAQENQELRGEVTALTGQREEAQLRVEALERQYDQAASELAAARGAVTAARTEAASEAAVRSADLESRLTSTGKELDRALRRVQKLTAEQARTSGDVESLRTELSSLQAEQEETLLAHARLQQQYAERESELKGVRAELKRARTELDRARTELEDAREEAATFSAPSGSAPLADTAPAVVADMAETAAITLAPLETVLATLAPPETAPAMAPVDAAEAAAAALAPLETVLATLAPPETVPAAVSVDAAEAAAAALAPLETVLAAPAPEEALPAAFAAAAETVPAEPAPTTPAVPAEPGEAAASIPAQPGQVAESIPAQPEQVAESVPAEPEHVAESVPAQPAPIAEAVPAGPARDAEAATPAAAIPAAEAAAPPKADRAEPLPPKVEAKTPPVMTVAATSFPTDFPIFSDLRDDFFSSSADDVQVFFMLQPGLGAVEYGADEDVVQLYRSVNVAYLSPEGKGQETCQGYICCLNTEGGMSVQAALYGVQSAKTWVYLPDEQPADEAGYAAAVRGAIAFAEQVGLMMEAEKPGMSPEQRLSFLQSCPVLKRT